MGKGDHEGMSQRPIILAEDNDKLRRLYVDRLEMAGFAVMSAADGEKAVALLHKIVNPQLIILDIMMPRLDGIATCMRMRQMQGLRPCPILFLTALEGKATVLECLKAGGDDFMMKCSPLEEIVERVTYWTRHGAGENSAERRERAIRELAEMLLEQEALEAAPGKEFGSQKELRHLAEHIKLLPDDVIPADEAVCRFGFLAGMVEAFAPLVAAEQRRYERLLRHLALKTAFINAKEVDGMIDNYGRLIHQQQFQHGWSLGSDHAATLCEAADRPAWVAPPDGAPRPAPPEMAAVERAAPEITA